MNLFAQGMRRSGTTITFDILFNDKDLDCYYEPLALAKRDAKGGGSGATDIDYFEKVRQTREACTKKCPQLESHEISTMGPQPIRIWNLKQTHLNTCGTIFGL